MDIDELMKIFIVAPVKEGELKGWWVVKKGEEPIAYFREEPYAWQLKKSEIHKALTNL